MFFFSSRRRHTRCALVTGVQTCALPICLGHLNSLREIDSDPAALTDAESARAEALTAEGNVIEADYEDAEELPAEVAARLEAIDEELAGLIERTRTYDPRERSEEHTSELQSLMRISYAVFCLKKKKRSND